MNKTLQLGAFLTIGAGVALGDISTEALEVTAGGLTALIQNNGLCVGNGCGWIYYGGTDEGMTIVGSIDGWQFAAIDTGPSLFALALTCVGAGCTSGPLHVIFSDVNFTDSHALFFSLGPSGFLECGPPIPGYHGPPPTFNCGGGPPGVSSGSAYYDAGNQLFAETSLINKIAFPPSAPYSLTIEETFYSNFPIGTVTAEGALLTTPEPGAVVLLATVLALCVWRIGGSGLGGRRASDSSPARSLEAGKGL